MQTEKNSIMIITVKNNSKVPFSLAETCVKPRKNLDTLRPPEGRSVSRAAGLLQLNGSFHRLHGSFHQPACHLVETRPESSAAGIQYMMKGWEGYSELPCGLTPN